jgi:hypothetical protein
MSQHRKGMGWVIGALGLLYMGSLGTGVVRTFPLQVYSKSTNNIWSNSNTALQFIVIKERCNPMEQGRAALNL